jgi:hypothetical protein
MTDGSIVSDRAARTHYHLVELTCIDQADIVDTGFIINGEFKSNSGGIPQFVEQARAKKKVQERLLRDRGQAEASLKLNYNKVV